MVRVHLPLRAANLGGKEFVFPLLISLLMLTGNRFANAAALRRSGRRTRNRFAARRRRFAWYIRRPRLRASYSQETAE